MNVPPRVGMVGGGQLARMSCQAAIPLGLTLRVLAEHAGDSAATVCGDTAIGSHTDAAALATFAAGCDILTFDHELVPPELLAALEAAGHDLRPSPAALLFAQDKLHQRTRLAAAGFPVPPFVAMEAAGGRAAPLAAFAREHGWPLVLKAARGGYDGRGVWLVHGEAEAAAVIAAAPGVPFLAEAFVPIARELAVLVARSADGQMAVYPVVETVQVEGMCREVLVPGVGDERVERRACTLALMLAEMVGAVGIMAVELFQLDGGELLINELALRPHNSGHYSIEGCESSQFENHLRAVLGWPLGSPALRAPAVATVNVVGNAAGADPRANLPRALAVFGAHPHLYGKGPRPGRKLGHVTALGDDPQETRTRALRAAGLLMGAME